MPAPRDRFPTILEQAYPSLPLPPLGIFCSSGFSKDIIDIKWTSPTELQANTKFNIIGINIYRSFDSEFGPYIRLNTTPIGITFWRDKTKTILALQENVSGSFTLRGPESDPNGEYAFRTKFKPIVIYPSLGSANYTNLNVQVTINGEYAYVEKIDATNGVVWLRRVPTFDVASQTLKPPVLPLNDSDLVLATYKYTDNEVKTNLAKRVFYRLATVAYDENSNLIETPLERATQTNNLEVEKLDYIWAEAVRRNKWILYQGGERVKAFIRKIAGPKCGCGSDSHKQPDSSCLYCFGSGILGGYEFAGDIIIAPDDADKSIAQSNRGRSLSHSYDVWTGPSPLLSQRDFIVKLNNDRYGIGPVRMPSCRGMQLQQHFPVSHLDETDIRYMIPMPDLHTMIAPQTEYLEPGHSSTPMITNKTTIPDERQIRSTSVTEENILY